MANLQVVVNKLNKRKFPVINFADKSNIAGVVESGYTFEGKEFTDLPDTAFGIWYKDTEGYFYWGGGVKEIYKSDLNGSFDNTKMSWGHRWYNLPFIWNDIGTSGSDITVCIIDTGIDALHTDLNIKSKLHPESRSFVDDNIFDLDGHGTSMAGIIGAKGSYKVFGVAPDSRLLILKASVYERGADIKKFAEALDFASSVSDVDIISFSNIFPEDDATLKKAVQRCIQSKKVIVSAIGNSRDVIRLPNGPDKDTFPACYADVISVGAFNQNGSICEFSNWNSHLSCSAPGESILTTGINNSSTIEQGTSIATAFTSGCLALILSYAKKNSIQPQECIRAIFDTCEDIGSSIGKDIQSGYGNINLRNAISKIKKI